MLDIELLEMSFERGKCIVLPITIFSCSKSDINRAYSINAILDTGATSTHVSKKILLEMGYDEKDFRQDTKISLSVTGRYSAMVCRLQKFAFCGLTINDFDVKVWEPPDSYHADGIIGMNVIRYYNLHINSDTQKVTVNRSEATNSALRKL